MTEVIRGLLCGMNEACEPTKDNTKSFFYNVAAAKLLRRIFPCDFPECFCDGEAQHFARRITRWACVFAGKKKHRKKKNHLSPMPRAW